MHAKSATSNMGYGNSGRCWDKEIRREAGDLWKKGKALAESLHLENLKVLNFGITIDRSEAEKFVYRTLRVLTE